MSYEEKIKIYQSMIRNLEIELKHYEGTPYFEDEEFKIRERINMHKEELRLYSQAAKADEYEKSKHRTHVNDCKAEAFDAILKSYDEALSKGHLADEVSNIIEKYESSVSE